MEKGGVQSLDRAFTLLELLCKSPGGMAIHQITELTGLNKSTVHRMPWRPWRSGAMCAKWATGYTGPG